jgi:hypothetical protein
LGSRYPQSARVRRSIRMMARNIQQVRGSRKCK